MAGCPLTEYLAVRSDWLEEQTGKALDYDERSLLSRAHVAGSCSLREWVVGPLMVREVEYQECALVHFADVPTEMRIRRAFGVTHQGGKSALRDRTGVLCSWIGNLYVFPDGSFAFQPFLLEDAVRGLSFDDCTWSIDGDRSLRDLGFNVRVERAPGPQRRDTTQRARNPFKRGDHGKFGRGGRRPRRR